MGAKSGDPSLYPRGNGGPLKSFKRRFFRWWGCVDVITFELLGNRFGYTLWRMDVQCGQDE